MKFDKTKKNIPVINAYRAIGIILVMFAHYTYNIVGFFSPNDFISGLHNVGYVAVMIFFSVSGFVIPWWLYHAKYRIKDYFRFVGRRLTRIEPPFLAALALAIIYTFVRTMSPHFNGVDTIPSVKQTVLQLGYLVPFTEPEIPWIRPAYWTLAIEAQFYLLMGLLYPLITHAKLIWRTLAYTIILGGCIYLMTYTSGIFPWPYLFRYFPILLSGILLCLVLVEKINVKEYLIVSAVNIAVIIYFLKGSDLLSILFLPPMILFFRNYTTKFLNFIGNMSYSIYLMHSITGTAVLNYLSHVVENPYLKVLALLFGIVFTLFCSWVFYKLVEKPSHRLSLRIAINEFEFAGRKKKVKEAEKIKN